MDAKATMKTCLECGNSFVHGSGRGEARTYCTPACRDEARKRRVAAMTPSLPTCRSSWCEKPANRVDAGLCEACYASGRRNGEPRKPTGPKPKRKASGGYWTVWMPGHPIADKQKTVRLHRLVVYDAIGEGPHPCHWCGEVVEWERAHVDHVNSNKLDNRLANLAYSCRLCNVQRGAMVAFMARLIPGRNEQALDAAACHSRKTQGE